MNNFHVKAKLARRLGTNIQSTAAVTDCTVYCIVQYISILKSIVFVVSAKTGTRNRVASVASISETGSFSSMGLDS